MNVLLSRARQKLVLATSQRFIREVVDGIDPDGMSDELDFLRKMLKELARLEVTDFERVGKGASVVTIDENGKFPS
jgi:DNA polymerase alpha-associated DNA helicase A